MRDAHPPISTLMPLGSLKDTALLSRAMAALTLVLIWSYVDIEIPRTEPRGVRSRGCERGNRNGAKDCTEARPTAGGPGTLHRGLRLSAQPRRTGGPASHRRR